MFLLLLKHIGKARYNKTLLIVFIVFIESKHVFLDDITLVRNSLSCDYKTAIEPYNKMQAANYINFLEKSLLK